MKKAMRLKKKQVIGLAFGLGLIPSLFLVILRVWSHYMLEWELVYHSVVAVPAVIAGFITKDWRIGVIVGVIGGLWMLPFTLFSLAYGFQFLFWTNREYWRSFNTWFLIAWVGGTVGGLTPKLTETITSRIRRIKTPRYLEMSE
jgi:hypothetical protein